MADERTALEKIADIPVDEFVNEENVAEKSLSPKGEEAKEEAENEEGEEESSDAENVEEESSEQNEETVEAENKEEEKKPAKKPWQVKRVDKLYAEKKALEEELARLKSQTKIEEKETYTKQELEEIAKQKADELHRQRQQEEFIERHNDAVDSIAKKAGKIDAEFNDNLKGMIDTLGAAPMSLQRAIVDLEDDGPAVLAALVKDEDEAARFYKMSETKVAIELTKLAAKINAPAPKPKPKLVSSAPKPPPVVNTNGRTGAVLSDKLSDAEWMEIRNREVAEKLKRQGR